MQVDGEEPPGAVVVLGLDELEYFVEGLFLFDVFLSLLPDLGKGRVLFRVHVPEGGGVQLHPRLPGHLF